MSPPLSAGCLARATEARLPDMPLSRHEVLDLLGSIEGLRQRPIRALVNGEPAALASIS